VHFYRALKYKELAAGAIDASGGRIIRRGIGVATNMTAEKPTILFALKQRNLCIT